jgi:hypothetical protein
MYANWALTALATILFIYLALAKKLDFKLFSEPELIPKHELPQRAVVIPPENLGKLSLEDLDKKGKFLIETIKPEPEKRQQSRMMPEQDIINSLKPSAPKQETEEKTEVVPSIHRRSAGKNVDASASPSAPQKSTNEAFKLVRQVLEVELSDDKDVATAEGATIKLKKGQKVKVYVDGEVDDKGQTVAKAKNKIIEDYEEQVSNIDEETEEF